MAADTAARITSGELNPFAGPIHRQDGSLAVPEGEVMDDGTLAAPSSPQISINWYVQGIDDTLPQ